MSKIKTKTKTIEEQSEIDMKMEKKNWNINGDYLGWEWSIKVKDISGEWRINFDANYKGRSTGLQNEINIGFCTDVLKFEEFYMNELQKIIDNFDEMYQRSID